jgi:hypothetical protein
MRLLPLAGFLCGIAVLAIPAPLSALSGSTSMRSHIDFSFDCDSPVHVTNYPVHGDFTAVLNPDNSASADLAISGFLLSSNIHFDAKLGGGRRPGPGGTTQLDVLGRNHLRAIWGLPNNNMIGDVTVHGHSCAVSLAIRLKPGQHEYSMWGGNGFYYCTAARVLHTTCDAE